MGKKSKPGNCEFWKFVSHPIQTTPEMAEALAKQIDAGHFTPPNQHGERYYKSGGWCYDIGRKAYLIETSDGVIYRGWALSIKELRESLYLSRATRVVKDPFFECD